MNKIFEGAAMLPLPHYAMETHANALSSYMFKEDGSSQFTALVRNEKTKLRKLLRFYPEQVNFLLEKYKTDQATAESNELIMRYAPLVNKAPQQCADDFIAKACKIADLYDESTVNVVFIGCFDASVGQNLPNHWAKSSKAVSTDISFQTESLLYIQKD